VKSVWKKTTELVNQQEESLRGYLENTPAAKLSALEVHVLAALYEKDDQHASELARSVGRAATSFTPPLDRLQGAGLLMRRNDPEDRRAVYIYLTNEGEALRPHITAAIKRPDSDYQVAVIKSPHVNTFAAQSA
jgi:DNA-binding MarR family transcriptional regulator